MKSVCWTRLAVAGFMLVTLSACVSTNPSVPAAADAHAAASARALPLVFAKDADRILLAEAALLDTFTAYWQAHVDRDWGRRFRLEEPSGPTREKFYRAYYARAWSIVGFEVQAVEVRGDEAMVQLHVRYAHPDEEGVFDMDFRRDRWIRLPEGWRHRYDDPILTGIKEEG